MPFGELPKIKTIDGTVISGFPVEIQNPPKTCVLRLPTNEELVAFLRSQKSLYRLLGRGKGQSEEVVNPEADRKLFTSLRLDGGTGAVEFDDAEMRYAIGLLTQNRITSSERVGQSYVIVLDTLFGSTTHTVDIPTHAQREEYYNTYIRRIDLPKNVEERRYPPEPPVKLYDSVVREVHGYVGCDDNSTGLPVALKSVPVNHKISVVSELLSSVNQLDPAIGGGSDPNL